MPAGRPTSFKQEYIGQAEKLCALGATDDEIADFFDVSKKTIYRWKLEYPEFCHSITNGKDIPDERVERSLYQRATGYYVTEQQAVKVKVSQHEEKVEVVDVEKYITASDTAAIFWLKNRRKMDWRDKHEHELSGPNGAPIELIQRRIIDPNGDAGE